MRYQIFILLIISSFLISCGSTDTPNTAINTAKTTPAANNTNSNILSTNKPTPTEKVNEAQSIKPIVDGYYESLKKKDEAEARKYLSAAALKYYETEAKSEKKTWFTFVLEENDPVDEKREVRNEKVEGNKAVAEIKGGNFGGWIKVAFIKENNEWKFDSPENSPDLNIPKTEKISNASK